MVKENELKHIVHTLLAPGKGILAADESMGTCDKRFDKYGVPKTPEMRRAWRELLFTASGIEKGLSGVILFDETIWQNASDGTPFATLLAKRGILPGIKVDRKTEPLQSSPKEEVTKGLEGLPERLAEYARLGSKFTKWRAVIHIGDKLPTQKCLEENARRMAEFAKKSQEAGLVPIIEPEVFLDGTHSLARSEAVLTETLHAVFQETQKAKVAHTGLILKSSMTLPGKESGEHATPEQIAEATLRAFFATVPSDVPGIVFLSGGQTPDEATARLNEIVKTARKQNAPWRISFSYSRALQEPALNMWRGDAANAEAAQQIFQKRVEETARASEGKL